jgi:hypothetical protein
MLLLFKVKDFNVVFTIIASEFYLFFIVQKQKLDELHLFKELFADFNRRYDALNEKLNQIIKDSGKSLGKDEIDTLYDYFNLCGEEYFFYKHGYIYPEVWKVWCNGIDYYLKDKRIGDLWLKEEKTESYYDLTRNEISKHVTHK